MAATLMVLNLGFVAGEGLSSLSHIYMWSPPRRDTLYTGSTESL
jgi:hypothetical protein